MMASGRSKHLYFIPFILWATAILIATLIPSSKLPSIPGWGFTPDKLIHFIMFFILVISFIWGYKRGFPVKSRKFLLWVVTFCILYGLLLETGQILVPGRSFSWQDITANGLGSATGALFSLFYEKVKSKLP